MRGQCPGLHNYNYDQVGRLAISHSGAEARAHVGLGSWGTQDGPYSQGYEFDVWGNVTHKYGWGGEVQGGSPTGSTDINYSYTGNRRNGFSYDAAGNLTNDIGQTFTYDATGQQTLAAYSGYSLQQSYDGDGLRLKKSDNGAVTYYLRSSVLGGQVVAETNSTGGWTRGYVYAGSQLLAVQQQASVYWMHEDPITKSKRVTNSAGTVVSTVELDPWGADTSRSSNGAFQPKKFTSYDRDANGTDEAMFRRYNRWQSRMDQPDPYDGSYHMSDPQSFNRYAYVQGDPVNLVDPTGLDVPCQDVVTGKWERCPDTDPADTIYTNTWGNGSLFDDYFLPASQGSGSRFGPVFLMPSPREAQPLAPTPQKPPTVPPTATSYTCDTISGAITPGGVVQGSAGLYVDSNAQVYPAFGLNLSGGFPASYTRTTGSGPVQPGVYLTGTSASGLGVTHTVNIFNGNVTREVGGGTPTYSVGVQVVLPPLEGTTDYDRRSLHADYGHGSWCSGGHRW